MLPEFIVAGAARCGTTSLYYYLSQHPEIGIPRKETFFFARDYYQDAPPGGPPRYRDKNSLVLDEGEYDQLFNEQDCRIAGEISTCYGYLHQQAVPRIREKLGDIPILFLLRHPVVRAWSGYRHFANLGFEHLSFEEAIRHEDIRQQNKWDFMWQYTDMGFYAGQVGAFQSAFSKVKVILSEDLFSRPEEVLGEIFSFIGVETAFSPDTSRRYNFSEEDTLSFLYQTLNHPVADRIIKPLLRKTMSRTRRIDWRHRFRKPAPQPGPGPAPETVAVLREMYREDIASLRSLTGSGLTPWQIRKTARPAHEKDS